MTALEQLRALARYQTHGGYRWAAIMADGELVCEKCASDRSNYRLMFNATKHKMGDDWEVVGLTNSGESDQTEYCAHCNDVIWEIEE